MNNIEFVTIKDVFQLEQIIKSNKENIRNNSFKAFSIARHNKQSEILNRISDLISVEPNDSFNESYDFYSTPREGYSISKIYIFNELYLVLIQTTNE